MVKRDERKGTLEIYLTESYDSKIAFIIAVLESIIAIWNLIGNLIKKEDDFNFGIFSGITAAIAYIIAYFLKENAQKCDIFLDREKMVVYRKSVVKIEDICNIKRVGKDIIINYLEDSEWKNVLIPFNEYNRPQVYIKILKEHLQNNNYTHIEFKV